MLALPLLDELASGLGVVSTPALAHATGAGLVGLTTALLAVPMLTGVVEAPILAWTDRRKAERRLVVAAGLVGMCVALLVMASAHGAIALAIGAAVYGPSSGLALGTAEAMLVDGASADDAARRLARWTTFASVGDVLAPAAIAIAGACGVSFRATFRATAVVLLVVAAAIALTRSRGIAPSRAVQGEDEDDAHAPLGASLRAALSDRRLFAWLLAAALCTLLDEPFAVLAAIWTSARFGPAHAAPMLVAFAAGGAVGATVLERVLVRTARAKALVVASSATIAALAAWLVAPSPWLALAACFVLGSTASPLHPLAKAEAFAVLPSRPGLVNGAAQAFVAVDLLAPAALAWVAERHGARVALLLLAAQPLFLLAMAGQLTAWISRMAPRSSPRSSGSSKTSSTPRR